MPITVRVVLAPLDRSSLRSVLSDKMHHTLHLFRVYFLRATPCTQWRLPVVNDLQKFYIPLRTYIHIPGYGMPGTRYLGMQAEYYVLRIFYGLYLVIHCTYTCAEENVFPPTTQPTDRRWYFHVCPLPGPQTMFHPPPSPLRSRRGT